MTGHGKLTKGAAFLSAALLAACAAPPEKSEESAPSPEAEVEQHHSLPPGFTPPFIPPQIEEKTKRSEGQTKDHKDVTGDAVLPFSEPV